MAEVMRYWAGTLHSVHPSQFGMQQYVKDPVVWASDYDALAARLADVDARLTDAIAKHGEVARKYGESLARLAEAERALDIADQAICERLSGLSGDPLQPVADAICAYWASRAPDSADVAQGGK